MIRLRWFTMALWVLAIGCDDPPPDPVEPIGSRVELAAGNVWLTTDGGKDRLITGAMLPETATLEVGEGSRALIRLSSGASVFFREESEAVIDGAEVALKRGELWADVPDGERDMGRFTSGAVSVSASGAGLDISASDGEVKVYVARGLAVVTGKGGRAEVASGEETLIKGDAKPEVSPVRFWEDWTGGMADRELMAGVGGKASGRIYGMDRTRPGSLPEELQILAQNVRINIRDGVAHTVVDQQFFNPTSTPLEGWYWFTVPEGASVDRFALEVNGTLINGEMIERKQAAAAYEEAVQRDVDPALLEWVDGRTFRARIYPIPAAGERRVILSYFELLPLVDGVYRYVYPMAAGEGPAIQEFSLHVDLGDEGENYAVSTLQEARLEQDGSAISMRRSGFRPRADFLLELEPTEAVEPLRALRFNSGGDEADYVMLRYAPEADWDSLKTVPGDVVVILDTSAGGDPSDRQVRSDTVEAVLRALSASDRFAVVAADLVPRVIYPADGLANADEANVSEAVEKRAEVASAGATDLGEMYSVALDLLYDAEQPAVVYVGDGLATVGETSSEELTGRLRRALGDSRARLFTIGVGADADTSLLERLARVGGGRSFTIATGDQTVQEALRFVGLLKTPTITDLEFDVGSGLDQVFTTATGKITQGDEVILLARTHHDLPDSMTVTGRLAGKAFEKTLEIDVDKGAEHGYISVLWAREFLGRLMSRGIEENRGRIISLGLSYSLMTPLTSFLVLESEAAYHQQGIQRRNRHRFSLDMNLEKNDEAMAVAAQLLPLPLGLMGCSEMSADGEPPGDYSARSPKSAEMEEVTMARQESKPVTASPAPAPPAEAADESMAGEGFLGTVGAGSVGKGGGGGGRGGVATGAPSSTVAKSSPKRKIEERKNRMGTRASGMDQVLPSHMANLLADGDLARDREKRPMFQTKMCSDASRRPLSQRRVLWMRRLARVTDAHQYRRVFFEAGNRCELPRWRDQRVMLNLIERKARGPVEVSGILSAFNGNPKLQNYLRRRILRRTLDPDATMGLRFPDVVNWQAVLTGLAALKTPEARIEELKRILDKNPQDPVGRGKLVELLVDLDMLEQAMAEASRLRRDGLASPKVLEILCDLKAAAGEVDEARRTCSELVEFNSDDPDTRKRLGDMFLRHGWYDEAYRQYASLVRMRGDDPLSLLRLAAAAAGMGKVDEALRFERKVATGDGDPGPADPRRIARLHSAFRIALMLLEAREKNEKETIEALERALKRTQVFASRGTFTLLVWEDFEQALNLDPTRDGEAHPVSEQIRSSQTGLIAFDLGASVPGDLELKVESKEENLKREVPYTILNITWDGKDFKVEKRTSEVKPA